MVTKFRGLCRLAIDPGAVLGIQIREQKIGALPHNLEMTARKGVVVDDHIGYVCPANSQRRFSQFPLLRHRPVFVQQAQPRHNSLLRPGE